MSLRAAVGRGRGRGGRGRGKPMLPPEDDEVKSVAAPTQAGVASVACDGRPEVPTQEELTKFHLPSTYRIKYCALCNLSSLSLCEFVEIGCAWTPLLPWGNGTKLAPSGSYCRICKYVFVHAGFGIEHGSTQAYTEATRRNPSIHHEFLTSRSKWIGMKKDNPQLQLRGKDDLSAARQVVLNQTQEDTLEGEREYLMRLDVYTKKYGAPPKNKIVKQVFRGKTIEGVLVVREEDEGMYRITKKQKYAVSMQTQLTDPIELRENQAENMFNKAFQSLLSTAADTNAEFVLCSNTSSGSSSSVSGSLMILNTRSGNSSTADAPVTLATNTADAATPQMIPKAAQQAARGDGAEDDAGDLTSGLLGAFGTSSITNSAVPKVRAAKAKAKPTAKASGSQTSSSKRKAAESSGDLPRVAGAGSLASLQPSVRPAEGGGDAPDGNSSGAGKRGRVAAQALAENDEKFVEEMKGILFDVLQTDANKLPDNEAAFIQLCKTSNQRCQDVANKCGNKINQMKRRKHKDQEDALNDSLKDVSNTATTFARLFSELQSSAPKVSELSMLMDHAIGAGFAVGNLSHMKLLKAKVFEFVKYNRYPQVAVAAAEVSQKMTAPEDQDFFQKHFTLILEQVLQKIIRTLPTSQLKLTSPGVQYVKSFLQAIQDHDALSLAPVLQKQVPCLLQILTVDNKTILPNQVIDSVKSVKSPQPTERLFITMKSLPQGHQILQEALASAEGRMASDSCLAELAKVTEEVNRFDPKTVAEQEGVIPQIVESWDKVMKLVDELKDKPEQSNVTALVKNLHALAKVLIRHHVTTELCEFMASQTVHSNNKMKCLPIPSWPILALRKHLGKDDDEIFRLHETISQCCAALDVANECGESKKTLTLQECQEHMMSWEACQSKLKDHFQTEKLVKSLDEFRTCLFAAMQRGFQDTERERKTMLIQLVNNCLSASPTCEVWGQLKGTIDDYQRLGTAEVFSEDKQQEIQLIGDLASIVHKLAFNCISYMASSSAVKISPKPNAETSALFKSLREIKTAVEQMVAFNDTHEESVSEILQKHGVISDLDGVIEGMRKQYATWTSSLAEKIQQQSETLAKEITNLQLPVYNPQAHEESEKVFLQNKNMDKAAAIVAKLQAYVTAASVCSKLAALEVDISTVSSAVMDGKLFMYLFTIFTVMRSPFWKSMTPEMAQKSESPCGELTKNLEFAVKQAASDGVTLPGEVQSMVSDKLKLAGVSL